MAMNRLMQMTPVEIPAGPDIGNFINPLMAGIDRGDRLRQQDILNRRADTQLSLAQNADTRAQKSFETSQHDAAIKQIGGLAQAALAEQDPARRGAIMQRIYGMHPEMVSKLQASGVDPNDHPRVAQMFVAEAKGFTDPLAERQKDAQIGLLKAQTRFANSRAALSYAKAAPQEAPKPDPLQGAGLDENGEPVLPREASAEPAATYPWSFNAANQNTGSELPAPMKLGGPMDDVDRSMRVDEGRVKVAQANGLPGTQVTINPEVSRAIARSRELEKMLGPAPGPRGEKMLWDVDASGNPYPTPLTGFAARAADANKPAYEPTPEEIRKARLFGPAGMTSPSVSGVITDAGRNRRVDVPATREAQGQRAYETATPEQQDRLLKLRRDQEFWTGAYKVPPRAGYYYDSQGREVLKTDKNFKGDKETLGVAMFNVQRFEKAIDALIGKPINGDPNKRSGNYSYPSRAIQGALDIGEPGQAFSDVGGAAENIAYTLSGKTVTNTERESFKKQFAPQPLDSEWRILQKRARFRQFYDSWISAVKGGESYDRAFQKALSGYGVKNPDGTAMGEGAGTDAGKPAEDLSKLPTDELLRRLQGGR